MATSDKILLPPPTTTATSESGPPESSGSPAAVRPAGPVVGFVALLGLLLAAFPARNSDLWQHLASGRRLLSGDLAAATPTWLYDAVCYAVYATLGGPGLVLAKAALIAAVAVLLLRLCQAGGGWLVPACCTVLSLLALSAWLALQPAIVGYFFLTLFLWYIRERVEAAPATVGPASWRRWGWPFLLLAWVFSDRAFPLGIAILGLVLLGHLLERLRGTKSTRRAAATLLLFVVAALALVMGVTGLAVFVDLGRTATAPFRSFPLSDAASSPPALAYLALLGLGLLSFLLTLRHLSWSRLLPWAALAVLSSMQPRLIPYFALVAGPALALNLQQFAARRGATPSRSRPGLLAAALGLTLLVCAWPGWLQAPPYGPRRLAVEPSPALVKGAEAVRRWHHEKTLTADDRGLHLSRESAAAFAWFCPEENAFFDGGVARALRGEEGAPADWPERLRAAGVNHVILHDPDPGRLFAAAGQLFADPRQWPLLHLEGNLAIFGWRDPRRLGSASAFRGRELDLERLAFDPGTLRPAPADLSEAAPPRRWWEAFWKPAPAAAVDRGEATLHYMHAEVLLRQAAFRHRDAWDASQSAGLVAAAGGWSLPGGLLDAQVRLVLLTAQLPPQGGAEALPPLERAAVALHGPFSLNRDDVPPALLYLAVRAARRAVAQNPEDAHAYFVLGESYLRLLYGTRERVWASRLTDLAHLRQAQASTALAQALRLNPRYAQAHHSLGRLYQAMGYLDLARQHLQAYARLAPEEAPAGLSELARQVREQEEAYAAEAKDVRSLHQRAALALKKGLAGRARDMLLESTVAAFGTQGMALELELLARTGRGQDVRAWTTPELKRSLGENSYHLLRIQGNAAVGDYAAAQQECFRLVSSLAVGGEEGEERAPIRDLMALLISQAVVDGRPWPGMMTGLYWHSLRRTDLRQRVAALARTLRFETDVTVLRGVLALEEGDVAQARAAFTAALGLWQSAEAVADGSGMDFSSRPMAQGYQELLERVG